MEKKSQAGLVPRKEISITPNTPVKITPHWYGAWDWNRFNYTMKNLDSMIKQGCLITIVIPEKILNSEELELYRRYYCAYAKKMKRNFIYLQGPATVVEETT